jgi:hypothetical protein
MSKRCSKNSKVEKRRAEVYRPSKSARLNYYLLKCPSLFLMKRRHDAMSPSDPDLDQPFVIRAFRLTMSDEVYLWLEFETEQESVSNTVWRSQSWLEAKLPAAFDKLRKVALPTQAQLESGHFLRSMVYTFTRAGNLTRAPPAPWTPIHPQEAGAARQELPGSLSLACCEVTSISL